MSQFKELQADIRNQGYAKWKHVMHLIRLLISGIRVLRDGFVPMQANQQPVQFLTIKRGDMPWDETRSGVLACTPNTTKHWQRQTCQNVLNTRRQIIVSLGLAPLQW